MMKKILIVGNGAREHIITATLAKSVQKPLLYCIGKAKNPGIAALCEEYIVGDYMDHDFVCDVAQEIEPTFVVIGPDDPIGSGLADALLEYGFQSVAPLKTVARLESSKAFTRELITNYSIPGNPRFTNFTSEEGIKEFMESLGGEYVVKYDGLKGGKGVKLSGEHLATIDDGVAYATECLETSEQVVVEEKFVGEEFSLLCFTDGHSVVPMPIVQDYKRAHNGDTGPNTGGMGTYSDANHLLPFVTETDLNDAIAITEQVVDALRNETGTLYKGIIYGGFIAVRDGVRIIEFNARFGDPEVMNVLSLLETDLVEIFEAIIEERLDQISVQFKKQASVCVYAVPEGYPDTPCKGEKIVLTGVPIGVSQYMGSIDETDGVLTMGSSRAVANVGLGDTIEAARSAAYQGLSSIKGKVFARSDIASSDAIRSKVERMKKIRS